MQRLDDVATGGGEFLAGLDLISDTFGALVVG
jgi:hypothetical protein